MKTELEAIVKASNLIGAHKELVQGPGGNISIKVNDEDMLVKASGIQLDEVTATRGIVPVSYRKIRNLFYDGCAYDDMAKNDALLAKAITEALLDKEDLRPSMETGFHALLGRIVIHTHPIAVNLFTCMQEGRDSARTLFDDLPINWIDYQNPGYALSREINERVKRLLPVTTRAFLLQNHGLIVSSENFEDAVSVTLKINGRIARRCKDTEYRAESKLLGTPEGFINESALAREFGKKMQGKKTLEHLFPDTVVFCDKDTIQITSEGILYRMDRKKATATDEIMLAHIYLTLNIPQFGKINPLSPSDVAYIKNMEAEKYRQKL